MLLQLKKKLLYALESQAMLRARLGQQCLCRLGEPVRQQWSQLYVCDHWSDNFTIQALLDWAQCTPLMLNIYRQTPFHRGLCILDWSTPYSPFSCSYSGCLWGHQLLIRRDCSVRRTNTKTEHCLLFSPPLWTLGTCPVGGGVHAPQPVLLCAAILPGCCRKIISIVPHAGKLPRQSYRVYKPAVDFNWSLSWDDVNSWNSEFKLCY